MTDQKEKSTEKDESINKRMTKSVMWMTVIFLMLGAFICGLMWIAVELVSKN